MKTWSCAPFLFSTRQKQTHRIYDNRTHTFGVRSRHRKNCWTLSAQDCAEARSYTANVGRFVNSQVVTLLLLVGCATPPIDAINQAPPGDPSLADVRTRIEEFVGKRVRWGGNIVAVENRARDTQIFIVARPLDDYGRPHATGESPGRFVARVEGFLDPAVYDRGRDITIAGVVDGKLTQPVGDYQYDYVVLKAEALRLWERRVERPYYYRDPIYDPFWPGRIYPWYPWFPPYPFYPY